MTKKVISIEVLGMTCASCALSNEVALKKTEGISKVNVNFANKKATIEFDEAVLSRREVVSVVIKNGYSVRGFGADGEKETDVYNNEISEAEKSKKAFFLAFIFSAPLLSKMFFELKTGVVFWGLDFVLWLEMAFAAIVVFSFGARFHKVAFLQARRMQTNMDTLISMGTLVAFFYSVWAVFNGRVVYFETPLLSIL